MYADKKLLARCKKHDRTAFVELFKMYEKYLYKLCYSYTQNEQDALDLAQEVYIKVFKNIEKYNDKMPFHPWLRKIAVNTCLNYKRKISSDIISLNSEVSEDKCLEDIIPDVRDCESEVLGRELGRIIKEGIEDLGPKHRMVLILRYYEGLSYEEIASVLNEPLGTVKTNIYRARNMLKEKLCEVSL